MGTNYYRKRKATAEEKQKMIELINHNQIEELASLVNNINTEIHICKCSYGWKTLFDHNNGEYYELSRKSLEDFLNEPNTYIINEYGVKYTADEFWDIVNTHDNNEHNKFTAKSYKEYCLANNIYTEPTNTFSGLIKNFNAIFGFTPEYTDFDVDGIRFAVFTDFS